MNMIASPWCCLSCFLTDHYISIAHRMHKEMPNSYIFDQVSICHLSSATLLLHCIHFFSSPPPPPPPTFLHQFLASSTTKPCPGPSPLLHSSFLSYHQYKNKWNAIAHYDTLGEEILTQTSGKVDMVVIGAGTGGTLTGIGRKIKEKLPSCQVSKSIIA